MIYTVTWLPAAQNELARLWIAASDRAALSWAANQIDKELRKDAHAKGHPFDEDRILPMPPLVVVYSVYPDDCLVEVSQGFTTN